jgi:hypothetical protein
MGYMKDEGLNFLFVQSASLDRLDGVKKEGQSFGLRVPAWRIEDDCK